MGKKVFVVSSTFRENGNSEILAHEFACGAKDAGHDDLFPKNWQQTFD